MENIRLLLKFPFPTRYEVRKFFRLLELLEGNPETSHEQFKGGLFVLLGKGGKSFLTKHCWPTFEAVCPAILKASHSEKPSIVKVRKCSILSECGGSGRSGPKYTFHIDLKMSKKQMIFMTQDT